ncbi:MAG: uncharacterized protein QOE71_2425, partial [Pseudonocardiales bacterium]|nr:uncharacterized protein [Pseudonocardiales bacterium]
MALRLKPRNSEFFDLLAEGGRNVAAAGDLLIGLLDPETSRSSLAAAMTDLEHNGDTITHRILRQLNSSFVTPFDRDDIYRLAGSLDDVLDALDEATDFLVVAEVGRLPLLMNDQIRLLQRACGET